MAENIIGLGEAHADDPGARAAVLQRMLELLQKDTTSLEQRGGSASRPRGRPRGYTRQSRATIAMQARNRGHPCYVDDDGRDT